MPPNTLSQLIPRGLRLRSKMRWREGRWRLETPDRVFLEDVIAPYFLADDDIERILDIGVAWYTRSYPRLYRGVEYWSVDIDPDKTRIAGANHRTVSATRLADAFEADTFDLVVCNGVIGWGINTPADVRDALNASADVMKPGAWLVLGWNDVGTHRVPGLDDLLAERFRRAVFPPVGADHFIPETGYAHRFDFLRKL